MTPRKPLAVLTFGLCLALLCCQLTPASKRIELWKPRPPKPEAETTEPAEATSAGTAEETPEETRPAKILQEAALKHGLEVVGEIVSLTGESLKPEPEGESAAGQESEAEELEEKQPEARVSPLSSLPGYLMGEPFEDYGLVALAGGEFKHPRGQTLRAALFEFAAAQDAWGLWSIGRGEKSVPVGQAGNWGRALRVWKGPFAAVLSMDPPDERLDEFRLAKFARVLFAAVPGRGAPTEMIGWLPLGNQLAHTVTYFHANAPAAGETLGLSQDSEGVSAIYQIGERGYRAIIIRYPDREAALAAWDAFVSDVLGLDPSAGARGGRRRAPRAGGWSGVRTTGRVGAFVLGTPTLHQTEVMLAQTCARAHD